MYLNNAQNIFYTINLPTDFLTNLNSNWTGLFLLAQKVDADQRVDGSVPVEFVAKTPADIKGTKIKCGLSVKHYAKQGLALLRELVMYINTTVQSFLC